MGALLDVLLGRKFRALKFKTLAKVAISRVAILKNQRQVRYSHAKSDVVELLNLGHQERALLRVEHMIKEQNLMDAYVMIEEYCYLLIDRIMLLKKEKECHDEVKEAISSLIFASSRCGEFPELQQIRGIFTSRFGKEFAGRAVELRNNCGVNPKIIQKLSVRRPSLESRLKILKETASENGLVLDLEEDVPVISGEKLEDNQKQRHQEIHNIEPQDKTLALSEVLIPDEKFSGSLKARKKYRDVAAAALEAFESAAYAAAAARAAVELSRTKSQENDQDDRPDFIHPFDGSLTPYDDSEKMKNSDNNSLVCEKIHPIDYPTSESEGEDMAEGEKPGMDRAPSSLSSDSDRNDSSPKHQDLYSYRKHTFPKNEIRYIAQFNAVYEYSSDEGGNKSPHKTPDWISLKPEADAIEGKSKLTGASRTNAVEQPQSPQLRLDRKPLSMRTWKGRVD